MFRPKTNEKISIWEMLFSLSAFTQPLEHKTIKQTYHLID